MRSAAVRMASRSSRPPMDSLVLPRLAQTVSHRTITGKLIAMLTCGCWDYVSVAPPYSLKEFVQIHYRPAVEAIVDVWCDHPFTEFQELTGGLEDGRTIGGVGYHFVIGLHPHNASAYSEKVHQDISKALDHPRCVGLGEIGLDYHYNKSAREVQRDVLVRLLKLAVEKGKPITIHAREADEDFVPILKEHVPTDHKMHIHSFSDAPETAAALFNHFSNLFIGITGVVTFSSNRNTSKIISNVAAGCPKPPSVTETEKGHIPSFRLILETDSPYMVPANADRKIAKLKGNHKFPLSHSSMIPWIAKYVAEISGGGWTAEDVLRVNAANARYLYGV